MTKNKMLHLERARRLATAKPEIVSYIKELYESREYTNRVIAQKVFDKFVIRLDLGLVAPIAEYGGAVIRSHSENMVVYQKELARARKRLVWNQ